MTMASAAIPRTGFFGRLEFQLPWLALAPLLLIPIVGSNASSLNTLLFAAEVLLLVAGVKRAVWIPAALLLSEMTSANYMHSFGGEISNRLLLTMISVPIVLPHLAARVDLGKKARLTIGLGFAFVLLTTIVNMIHADDSYVIQFLRYIGIGFYFLLLIPAAVREREDLRDLMALLMIVAMLCAFAGIFQHWHDTRGTPLWQTIPHPGALGQSFYTWETRALGLSDNPISYGNVLMVSGLFALGSLLVAPFSTGTKRILAVSVLLMCAASYFTFTRSWAIAMIPALLALAVLYSGQYKKEFWVIIIVLAGGVWYWSDMQSNRYTQDASEDSSAAARPVLWTLGLNIAYDHPLLGVGHDSFLELSADYANTVDRSLLEQQGAKDVIGKYTPHNDPLNIWLSWGFGALLLYVIFSIVIGKNFYDTFSSSTDPLLRGLALGGLGALIGFEVNSMFHNFLDSTLTLWILAGFSLVLLKLAPREPVEHFGTPFGGQPVVLIRDLVGEWESPAPVATAKETDTCAV